VGVVVAIHQVLNQAGMAAQVVVRALPEVQVQGTHHQLAPLKVITEEKM
jgi:hypothetical protein